MKSAALGRHISEAEVTNISKHGFWLLLANEELFVAFKDFPWFKDASIAEIVRVEWPQTAISTGRISTWISQSNPSNAPKAFRSFQRGRAPPSVRTDERRLRAAST